MATNDNPKFGPDTLRKVADLARLQLTDAEVQKYTEQVGQILGYIEKLNTVDTSKTEPMTHPLALETPLRPDEARPSPGAEAMLACAPESLYESYKVPQVMGGGH